MEAIGTGAGLAALGFWAFVGIAVAAGVWDNIRKRDTQHETLRRIVESGQHIDDELTDKLLAVTGGSRQLDRDLKVSGLITLSIAPGMLVLGWFMRAVTEELWPIMMGVAGLMVCLSAGLLGAAFLVRHWYSDEEVLETRSGL